MCGENHDLRLQGVENIPIEIFYGVENYNEDSQGVEKSTMKIAMFCRIMKNGVERCYIARNEMA